MGLLDGVIGSVAGGGQSARKPGLGSTVAAGVVLALLVKGVRSYQKAQAQGETRSFDPRSQAPAQARGAQGGEAPGGIPGGLMGAGGLGGLLNGLGGAGALGALVSHFRQRGLGSQVNSWVGPGHNEPVAPDQVADALGEDNVRELQQQTGIPRESLLNELAQTLPEAVHELTPQGRLPSDGELHRIANAAPSSPG